MKQKKQQEMHFLKITGGLEPASTHEEDGYYRFRVMISGESSQATVRVDGSSGEIFGMEEELEEAEAEEEYVTKEEKRRIK